jgi:hypothetical protein
VPIHVCAWIVPTLAVTVTTPLAKVGHAPLAVGGSVGSTPPLLEPPDDEPEEEPDDEPELPPEPELLPELEPEEEPEDEPEEEPEEEEPEDEPLDPVPPELEPLLPPLDPLDPLDGDPPDPPHPAADPVARAVAATPSASAQRETEERGSTTQHSHVPGPRATDGKVNSPPAHPYCRGYS